MEPHACPVDERAIETILENNTVDLTFEVHDFRCSRLSGEGFLSHIFRISVRATKRHNITGAVQDFCKSFIAKVPLPPTSPMHEIIHLDDLLKNELNAYGQVVPFFKRCFGSKCLSFPTCYHADNNFIVQQDLGSLGFVKASRIQGLDFEHCRLAIEQIAKFHAMSIVCNNSEDVSIRNEYRTLTHLMKEQVYTGDKYRTYYQLSSLFDTMAKRLEDVPLSPTEKETMQTIIDSKQAIFRQACSVIEGGYYKVLCHGDYYVNNMLFKYDKMQVSEIKIVDLQTVTFCSAARDFIYFVANNRFHRDFDEATESRLLIIYVNCVNSAIDSLKVIQPLAQKSYMKYSVMRNEVRAYRLFKFLTSVWLLEILVARNPIDGNRTEAEMKIIIEDYRRLLEMFRTQDLLKN